VFDIARKTRYVSIDACSAGRDETRSVETGSRPRLFISLEKLLCTTRPGNRSLTSAKLKAHTKKNVYKSYQTCFQNGII
jgi:hypothetical protein